PDRVRDGPVRRPCRTAHRAGRRARRSAGGRLRQPARARQARPVPAAPRGRIGGRGGRRTAPRVAGGGGVPPPRCRAAAGRRGHRPRLRCPGARGGPRRRRYRGPAGRTAARRLGPVRRPTPQRRTGGGAHCEPDRDQPALPSTVRGADHRAPRMTGDPAHRLHVVSGKGGTGKTTIAAALACALATRGRRVLLCEVEGRHGIAELFGRPALQGAEEPRLVRTPAGGVVHGLAIDAEDALLEYLATFYRLGMAGRALDRFGVIDFATSIAPGLRDVLLTGKVYEAVRRREKGRRDA